MPTPLPRQEKKKRKKEKITVVDMTAEMEANDSFSSIFLVSSYMDRIMWCISFFQSDKYQEQL